jgi:hypothetical protein
MAKITQYSRISHHTLSGSASATFSVPDTEDFTGGTWTPYDLALSEIGVNEDAEKAFIRTGDTIKEITFVGSTASNLATVLVNGNNTGTNFIFVEDGYGLRSLGTSGNIILDELNGVIQIEAQHYSAATFSCNKIVLGSGSVKNFITTDTTTTTDATPTTIHNFSVIADGSKTYKVRVIGEKNDQTLAYLGDLFGLFNFTGGTISLIGTIDKVEKTNFTTATSNISISGSSILIRVTGEAATTINWSVYVEQNNYL